jgi:hypothetical protein
VSANDPVQAVLDLLTRAAHDRKAGALRWPVLASAAADGGADARMLVLRRFEREALTLELHTDARSPKTAQLRDQPRCTLVFFDARRKIQLRVAGSASIHHDDAIADAAFARAPAASLDDYRGAAPGEALDHAPAQRRDARANFAAIRIRMESADWLKLSRQGHARWRIDFCVQPPTAAAVAP